MLHFSRFQLRQKNDNDLIKNYNLVKSYRVPLVLKELNTGCFQFFLGKLAREKFTSKRNKKLYTKFLLRMLCYKTASKYCTKREIST